MVSHSRKSGQSIGSGFVKDGSGLMIDPVLSFDALASRATNPLQPVSAAELSAHLSARICHDLISPASAIVSGLDLLDDPTAQDMRADAMNLIGASAKKLVELLAFMRVAFGASATAEMFDSRSLKTLTDGIFNHVRPDLDWAVKPEQLNKPAARTLLNLALIGAGALPMGGTARLTAELVAGDVLMAVEAVGPRLRLRPEVQAGLKGQPKGEGVGGHWVQAYYLNRLLTEAGGSLELSLAEDRVVIRARVGA